MVEPSRLKIIIGKGPGNVHIIDSETGDDLIKSMNITSLAITCNNHTNFMPVAYLEIVDFIAEIEGAEGKIRRRNERN